jgi:tetratricopeptide (TPR) repeat protein
LKRLGKHYIHVRLRDAVTCLEKGLKIALNSGFVESKGVILRSLSVAYYDLGETTKAIECDEQALKIFQDNGDKENEVDILNNLGLPTIIWGTHKKQSSFMKPL